MAPRLYLIASVALLLLGPRALAQHVPASKVSVTIHPVVPSWSPDTDLWSVSTTGKVSVGLSPAVRFDIDFRWWGGARLAFAGGCDILPDECLVSDVTIGINAGMFAALYPMRTRWLYFRGGPGITYLQEDRALGGVIGRRISWPLSLLLGVGSDLRLLDFVYLTPAVDLLRTFSHDERLPTTGRWVLQAGVGITVG